MINFSEPPQIGHAIRVKVRGRRRWLRMVRAEPYVRKSDGGETFILHWEDDKGFRYTSGLRGKNVVLASPGGSGT